MLNFLQAKARELGAKPCPHCGQVDYAFGMAGAKPGGGMCINCQGAVPQYGPLQTMNFSLQVYREFVANYNDLVDSVEMDMFRHNLVATMDNFLEPILRHQQMPDDNDIVRLQEANKTMKVLIGSEQLLGGAVSLEFGKLSIVFAKQHLRQHTAKVLGTCCLAISYIQNYLTKPRSARTAEPAAIPAREARLLRPPIFLGTVPCQPPGCPALPG
jgi:hypothetical protein